jgi:hypothetical protein
LPVTVIERAFQSKGIASVTIPEGVVTIKDWAFNYNRLTDIVIPEGVTTIGLHAFEENRLTSVTLPNTLISIDFNAFSKNRLTSLTIPNSVTTIGNAAFAKNQLASVTISNGMTAIGSGVFDDNHLTSVTIPNSVTTIGHSAFSTNRLTDVTIPGSVTTIGGNAFSKNRLTDITIPNSVTKIGERAFEKNRLTGVTIPSGITRIERGVFYKNRLTHVTIPNSVKTIRWEAFADNDLTSITIGANVELFIESFDGSFNDTYNAVGKAAGTYTLSDSVWLLNGQPVRRPDSKSKDDYRYLKPHHISTGEITNKWIFSASIPNAVGTLDEKNNGITSITFGDKEEEPKYNIIAQNFSRTVYDDHFYYRFSPNFSDSVIVYSKTRVAVVANVKTGKAFHADCGLSMDDYLLGIRFLNPRENLFVAVKSIDEGNNAWEDYLHVMKLEREELVDAGWSMKLGETHDISSSHTLYHTWFVHDHKLFVYDSGKILCTDGKQPVSHPFSETFNANSQRINKIKDLAIHPTLPFGVVIEDRASFGIFHRPVVVRWDVKEPEKQIVSHEKAFEPLVKLLNLDRMMLAYHSFSPDGNWYVIGCIEADYDEIKSPHFIAIPVDPKHPDLLDMDNIVILGQIKNMTSLAWTSNPTAYIVSNGKQLHRWDLSNLP